MDYLKSYCTCLTHVGHSQYWRETRANTAHSGSQVCSGICPYLMLTWTAALPGGAPHWLITSLRTGLCLLLFHSSLDALSTVDWLTWGHCHVCLWSISNIHRRKQNRITEPSGPSPSCNKDRFSAWPVPSPPSPGRPEKGSPLPEWRCWEGALVSWIQIIWAAWEV